MHRTSQLDRFKFDSWQLRAAKLLALCLAFGVLITLAGCGSAEDKEAAAEAERAEKWSWLQDTKDELGQMRARIEELETEIAAAAESTEEGTEESLAQLQSELEDLEGKIESTAGEFNQRLVEYINNMGLEVGQERTEQQKQAFHMKSDEDILIAQEYIEQGGDYARAIQIMETAQQLDPDYEGLKEAIAAAEAARYMTEERFAAVEKGMTDAEVKAVLGPVFYQNIQRYPDKGRVAWFYPKGKGQGAAGVFFEDEDGTNIVYLADFNAVKPEEQEQ